MPNRSTLPSRFCSRTCQRICTWSLQRARIHRFCWGACAAGGQLCELRVSGLRFTASTAAGFLNGAMGLNLAAEDIATLEARTGGWIAGLQLAALSLQEHPDAPSFIRSFTGSHRFVLDARVERASPAPFTAPDRRQRLHARTRGHRYRAWRTASRTVDPRLGLT